ncbi:MAG: hypothetical protein KKH51_05480 [Actinobacteria bacterium]|nr:hypothetical protein [Actinomycetota bacterium]
MAKSTRDLLEIITAILLGLVSVATAFGAYQASVWAAESSRYASVSQQLRDRNLTEALTTQLIYRDDARRMLDAISLNQELIIYPERTDAILAEQAVLVQSATPQLATAWDIWVASGYSEELFPISTSEYEAAMFAAPQSMQYGSYAADLLADAVGEKADRITVASVVFAFALFLLGVAGVNPGVRLSAGLVIAAGAVFVAGLVMVLLAVF